MRRSPTAAPPFAQASVETTEPNAAEALEAGVSMGWITRLRWVPGVVLVGILVWLVVTHVSEEREIATLVQRSRPLWLLAAVTLQGLTYVCTAESIRAPVAVGGHALQRRELWPIAVLKLTMDQMFPSGGLSGTLLVLRRLRALGVPAPIVGAAFVIQAISYAWAYALAVLLATAVIWTKGALPAWLASAALIFVVGANIVAFGMLGLVWRRGRLVPPWMDRFVWIRTLVRETTEVSRPLLGRVDAFAKSGAASMAVILLDGLTLTAMLLALGVQPLPLVAFAALVMGSVAATVGVVPGGLGTFEAASVGTLVLLGVNPIQALGATLLLRACTFWLPMVVGVILYQRERRGAGQADRGSAAGRNCAGHASG